MRQRRSHEIMIMRKSISYTLEEKPSHFYSIIYGNFQLKDRMISTFIPPLKFTIGDWLKLQEVNKMFPRDDEDGEIWLRDNG